MVDYDPISKVRLILPPAGNTPASGDKRHESAPKPGAPDEIVDPVEFSEAGRALAASGDASTIRVDKVARLRSDLESGQFLMEGKLETVLDRILKDIELPDLS